MVLTVPEAEFGWSFSLCCTYLKRILQIYPIYTDEQHKKKAKREKMIIDQGKRSPNKEPQKFTSTCTSTLNLTDNLKKNILASRFQNWPVILIELS